MTEDLKKLFRLHTARERKLAFGVLGALVLAAGLQALAAGSLYPFLTVVSNSAALESGPRGRLYERLGFRSEHEFLMWAGIAVLILVFLSNAALAFAHWARLRFQYGVNHSLAVRLLKAYLGDYAYFLSENTAELNKSHGRAHDCG